MSTIDKSEIEKFDKLASDWWNPEGKFKSLHNFNFARLSYIREEIKQHFKLEESREILKNIEILDIGCGGGLVSEPLAKIGANVTAIDASPNNIEVARNHAKSSNIKIDYRNTSLDDSYEGFEKKFDVVLALEIIEHVDDVERFIYLATRCLKENGIFLIATLNRTIKSYLSSIICAEYILRWLEIGTHNFKKFCKPSEIYDIAVKNNLFLKKSDGFKYKVLTNSWVKDKSLSVNYIMVFLNE